jgi:cell division protein FtsW
MHKPDLPETSLNREHRLWSAHAARADNHRMLRAGDIVVLCALALLSLGLVMTASADMQVGEQGAVTFASIVGSTSAIYMALAVAAMLIARALPVRTLAGDRRVRMLLPLLLPVSVGLVVLALFEPFAYEVNGARRWFEIPGTGFRFQPSEVAKWSLPVVLAWWGATRGWGMRRFGSGLLPAVAMVCAASAAIGIEDLGTGALVFGVGVLLIAASGARWWQMATLASPVFLAGLVFGILAEPYRRERIIGFLNPYSDPSDLNYHMIQSLSAIAGGGGTGRGLGFGLQKFGYLPEDRTDFLYAIICEELGLVGAGGVLVLYALLLVAGLTIVRREPSVLLKLIGLGVILTLGFQALMNLMVVTGLAPTKGIALPLLSAGGTGWLLTASSLGVLASIDRSREAGEHRGQPCSSNHEDLPHSARAIPA